MSLISVVIPCYKSGKSLKIISEQIYDLSKEKGIQFEVIFVNDSPAFTETCNTLGELSRKYDFVQHITLRKNQGQHMALLVGLSRATGEYVITMDDDLQHPVSEIPKLIAAIKQNPGVDAVFAVPKYKLKKHSLWRNAGSFILNKTDTLFLEKPKGLIKSPFRIFTADVRRFVAANHNAMPALSSLIIKSTDNIININVAHDGRAFGKSNYTLRKLISLSLNNILHYSSLPLKLVGFIGFGGFIFSILFILLVLVRKYFFGITFPGYASTVSLISFFGGLNLLGIGLIGEYLIRIIKEQQKPDLSNLIKTTNE
jgi:glycosyltransferase involved in cell wall biosynthesis